MRVGPRLGRQHRVARCIEFGHHRNANRLEYDAATDRRLVGNDSFNEHLVAEIRRLKLCAYVRLYAHVVQRSIVLGEPARHAGRIAHDWARNEIQPRFRKRGLSHGADSERKNDPYAHANSFVVLCHRTLKKFARSRFSCSEY
jgi:hypothetical protein